jgi:hypothetical protein
MMFAQLNKHKYKVSGNKSIDYDGEVIFPINGVLAKMLGKNNDVKIVLLKKEDIDRNCDKNVEEFKKELSFINRNIGAKIEYEILSIPHNESRETQENLFKEMVDELIEDADIYADITFSTKSLPIITFSVLNFAERFFNCDIKNIVYGRVDFDKNNNPINPELFDMTSLFYLNSIVSTLECETAEQAKKMLANILSE